MRTALLVASFFLFSVWVHADPAEQAFVQDTVKAIHSAQEPLVEMKSIEKKEIGKMEDAEQIEKNEEIDASSLTKVETDARETVKLEDKQQELALTSLTIARDQVDDLERHHAADPNMQQAESTALQKLKGVREALAQSTTTSNTQKKAEKIADEAKSLVDQLNKKQLGETLDKAPELNPLAPQAAAGPEQATSTGGASSSLEQAAAANAAQPQDPMTPQQKAAETPGTPAAAEVPATPAAAEGASSSLQQALSKKKEDTLAVKQDAKAVKQALNKDLEQMERQEAQVVAGEKADIAEVTRLADDLS